MSDIHYSEKIDYAFVVELAKRGNVHLCSSQVTVEGKSVDLSGVKIPEGVTIDWMGAIPTKSEYDPVAKVTFRFPD